ncbi:hypothetical protein, partial [Streptomyces violaceusniger]|uniref:hypothetical protein n=1 Tax=Streptomyces violaceusniger TaxID=68280 RepID=UPI0036852867
AMVLLSPFNPIGNLSGGPWHSSGQWQRCECVHGNELRDRHRKDQRLGRDDGRTGGEDGHWFGLAAPFPTLAA